MHSSTLLLARHLGVVRNGKTLLEDVSFALARGEIMAVVGPSGSGKTTLLRTINYLTPLTAGQIDVAGINLRPGLCERRHARVLARLRRTVGMVFQHYHLFPHFTVIENLVEAPVRVKGLAAQEARQQACSSLERLGIGHLAHLYPHQLSGGEQQRVALLRALLMDPELLLLDEPTSALDAANSAEVAHLLWEFADRGRAVLLVSHQSQLVAKLAHRIAILERGKLVALGPTKDIYPYGPAGAYLQHQTVSS